MIKGILFDFGDVILNYEQRLFVEELSKKHGIPNEEVRKVIGSYMLKGHDGETDEPIHFFTKFKPQTKLTSEDFDWLITKALESASLDPAMVTLIRRLKED